MNHLLALTIITDDRTGVVDSLAATIRKNHGNWLESSMSRLAGKFAGILLVSVADDNRDALVTALLALNQSGLRINVETADAVDRPEGLTINIALTSNDRPGIVEEISRILAAQAINVEELTTCCDNAPMSGELLFHFEATLHLPTGLALEDLRYSLEDLSDDLIVEFDSTRAF